MPRSIFQRRKHRSTPLLEIGDDDDDDDDSIIIDILIEGDAVSAKSARKGIDGEFFMMSWYLRTLTAANGS